jgi:hypothetical protein
VSVTQSTLLDCLVASPHVRRFLEVAFAARSRWHLKRFDQLAPARAQLRTLLGLVHRARNTLFGREHDFRRIRSVADFRRLVPLRTPVELWREYSQPGDTWPGGCFLDQHLQPAVISQALLAGHRRAMQTALALVQRVRPLSRLLCGPFIWLGEDSSSSSHRPIAARFPALIRHAVQPEFHEDGVNGLPNNAAFSERIRRLACKSPTCLVGPAERIATIIQQFEDLGGSNAWPELTAVLYNRRDPAFDIEVLRQRLPKSVVLLELLDRHEGIIAVEDPRYGRLRLLPDHGLFFELIPSGAANELQPPRLSLDMARTGVSYELVISSPAGVWASRSGLHVCFDELAPLLIRVVPAPVGEHRALTQPGSPVVAVPTVRSDGPAPTPVRASHRQSDGSSAVLPGSFVRTPWSAPADRG